MSKCAEWLQKKRKALIEQFGGKCEVEGCEEKEKLHFYHKVGFRFGFGESRGSHTRLKEVEEHPERFGLRCQKHHLQYDRENKLIDFEKEQAELAAIPF